MSARVRLDVAVSRYSFGFQPDKQFDFWCLDFCKHPFQLFPCSEEAFIRLTSHCFPAVQDVSARLDQLIRRFPALFWDKLRTVKGMVCNLDLTDSTPVCSSPYHILREIVHDLIDKGVVDKS
jgi:hypothetical protein